MATKYSPNPIQAYLANPTRKNHDAALLYMAHKEAKRKYNQMADKKYNCGDLIK